MTGILDQLLDLSRARLGGGIPVERHRCDIGELAELVVEELRPNTGEGLLVVSSRGDLRGEWDSGRLQQVLSNLLGNALRQGSPGCPVTLTLDGEDAERASVSVHNHGAIPKGIRDRLFEPFVGAVTARRGGSSTASGAEGSASVKKDRSDSLGLGLYIVQQVVLAHGGLIDVSSDPSRGTTFGVSLPRAGVR
jgi:signal transduction histidine kinase